MDEMPLRCPGFGNLRDVEYSNERPFTGNPEEVPLSSFFVKSKDWAYEKEVRMILPLSDASLVKEGNIHLFHFPPEALTGVIFSAGADTSLTHRVRKLINVQKLRHIKLQQANLSLRTFRMELADL